MTGLSMLNPLLNIEIHSHNLNQHIRPCLKAILKLRAAYHCPGNAELAGNQQQQFITCLNGFLP
jgi:hypothetical protein